MNYYFIAYILLAIVVGLSVAMKLFQTNRTWAGIIFLILSIFIFMFFGVRWFSTGNVVGTYTGSWPPMINTCPDYLVYFKKGTLDTCVDLLGVNRSGGTLAPWSADETKPGSSPTAANKYFPFTYTAGMNTDQMKVLCNAANEKNLTWEGITNGESCTYLPPSKVLGPNASGSDDASCPTPATGTNSITSAYDDLNRALGRTVATYFLVAGNRGLLTTTVAPTQALATQHPTNIRWSNSPQSATNSYLNWPSISTYRGPLSTSTTVLPVEYSYLT